MRKQMLMWQHLGENLQSLCRLLKNGRMCRFLMNVMLASGGYDWVVITTDKRAEYMAALETASTKGDIRPFAMFVISMIKNA